MKRLGFSEEDTENLFQIIFKDKRWNEFDRGTITIEQYTQDLKNEHPEYATQISTMFSDNWAQNFLKPKQEAIDMVYMFYQMYQNMY